MLTPSYRPAGMASYREIPWKAWYVLTLGALAAYSIYVGRPIRLWVSPFGDVSLALFLVIVQPSVGCS